jgi:hypothetical protein
LEIKNYFTKRIKRITAIIIQTRCPYSRSDLLFNGKIIKINQEIFILVYIVFRKENSPPISPRGKYGRA